MQFPFPLCLRQSNLMLFLCNLLFQGSPTIRQAPYTVNPGDSFTSKFWLENATVFGRGSDEEMIQVAFLYYPAKKILNQYPWGCIYDVPFGPCNATLTSEVLTSSRELERVFGEVPMQCQAKKEVTIVNATSTSMGIDIVRGSLLVSAATSVVVTCVSLLF